MRGPGEGTDEHTIRGEITKRIFALDNSRKPEYLDREVNRRISENPHRALTPKHAVGLNTLVSCSGHTTTTVTATPYLRHYTFPIHHWLYHNMGLSKIGRFWPFTTRCRVSLVLMDLYFLEFLIQSYTGSLQI
jgi:hypothetical protein